MAQCLDLRPSHWEIVCEILNEHVPDRKVLAFGSRATWTAKQYSDLDLAVLGDEPLLLNVKSALTEGFSESDLPFKVDIVEWARIDENFRDKIHHHSVVLHSPKSSFAEANQIICTNKRPDWSFVTIEDISEKVAMGPFGSSIKVETFVPNGVPIISGIHLRSTQVDDTPGYKFITEPHAQRLSNANVQRGDIILTHAGNIGQVAYIPENSQFPRYVISQRQFFMRCDTSKAIPAFVTAYFKSPEGQHKLLANASQVGVPSIAQPVTYLRAIEIPLPSLPEQHAIANVLGTLDEKIQLNRNMNETLEEIAQTLFKSWFVDFEPVRAKKEGRDTGLPKHIDDLFPDRLVDSELGEIPKGWGVGSLRNVAVSPRRVVNPAEFFSDTPYVGLKNMPRRSIALTNWETLENVKSNKYAFNKGEILFGKLRPYFHKVGLAPFDGACSTDIVVVTPKAATWSAFVLCLVSSTEFVKYTDSTSTGTKMPRTSWKTMSHYEFCLPPESIVQAFQEIVGVMLQHVIANILVTCSLTELRDSLLPKLVSGKLPLIDSERWYHCEYKY